MLQSQIVLLCHKNAQTTKNFITTALQYAKTSSDILGQKNNLFPREKFFSAEKFCFQRELGNIYDFNLEKLGLRQKFKTYAFALDGRILALLEQQQQ